MSAHERLGVPTLGCGVSIIVYVGLEALCPQPPADLGVLLVVQQMVFIGPERDA